MYDKTRSETESTQNRTLHVTTNILLHWLYYSKLTFYVRGVGELRLVGRRFGGVYERRRVLAGTVCYRLLLLLLERARLLPVWMVLVLLAIIRVAVYCCGGAAPATSVTA